VILLKGVMDRLRDEPGQLGKDVPVITWLTTRPLITTHLQLGFVAASLEANLSLTSLSGICLPLTTRRLVANPI
jgi:hypothetical protein